MTFVQFTDSDAEREWSQHRLSLGQPETVLHGEELPVHAVPEVVLDELQELNIPFRVVQEEELQEVLSEKGYEYFERLRERHPELLHWNATLPPARCIEISLMVPEYLVSRATEVIDRHGGFEIQIGEAGTVIRIDPRSEENLLEARESAPKVEIKAFLPSESFDELIEELAAGHIAGYDRGSQVVVLRDPDRSL
jgi:hypothetical protein